MDLRRATSLQRLFRTPSNCWLHRRLHDQRHRHLMRTSPGRILHLKPQHAGRKQARMPISIFLQPRPSFPAAWQLRFPKNAHRGFTRSCAAHSPMPDLPPTKPRIITSEAGHSWAMGRRSALLTMSRNFEPTAPIHPGTPQWAGPGH